MAIPSRSCPNPNFQDETRVALRFHADADDVDIDDVDDDIDDDDDDDSGSEKDSSIR